jgi:hypothetical protein
MELENQIKQWMNIDNQLKQYNEKIKELREKRNYLETNIIKHADANVALNINNEKVKIVNSKITEPLTFKYLERTLGEIIKSDTQVNHIIGHLKEKREIKYISEIKRFSNN